ncbi:MAG: hypothetical protein QM820_61015 [Minicystis sp.]
MTDPQAFMERVVPLICAHAVKCSPKMTEAGRAACLRGPGPGWSPLWLWGYFGALQADAIDRELAAGRYRFDEQRAARCIAALESATCHDPEWSAGCEPFLRAYVSPAVELGGACRRSDACIQGFCDAEAKSARDPGADAGGAPEPPPGRCVPFLQEGATCALDAECGPHHACAERVDPEHGKCVRLPKLGEPCKLTVNQCDGPRLTCAPPSPGAPRRCRPLPAKGELCGDPEISQECQPGLFCDINDAIPKCKSFLPPGAACRTEDACEDGLVCDGLVLGEISIRTSGAHKVTKAGQCKPKPSTAIPDAPRPPPRSP